MEKVVLDANVLFSNNLRTLFLWLSWNNLIEVVWSAELWDEVMRNYSSDQAKSEQFRNLVVNVIFKRFPNAMKKLETGFKNIRLPDTGDEHVVALALQNKVARIVTFNRKDFPDELLKGIGLGVAHPDSFLCELFDSGPEAMKSAVAQAIGSYTDTKPSKATYYESLRRTKVTEFVERLEELDEEIPEVWS